MKALTFHFSYSRFVAGKILGGLSRGGPPVYEYVPDAKLLGDDWVIVETRYCGICGSATCGWRIGSPEVLAMRFCSET
jgi:hypothetical protein